ncbi:ATP-grasp domain-containing protein [Streptomyces sp. NEAU-174]|uniref:ATP-grasp domain-containing protein n=1 Tax=Streptomyces sp. NEAU-174 TaxID=3458254 RepID=UPI004044F096
MIPWIVMIELHTLPGGARSLPTAGDPLQSSSEQFLHAARAQGYRTAVVTRNHSYYESHFDHLVDSWLSTDSTSPRSVLQMLAALDSQVVGVHSSVDSFVHVAAHVAFTLGLPGPSPDGAGINRDKARARRALQEAGADDTRWAVLPADTEDLSSPIGYPCVVKPVDGAYSWDVALVSCDSEAQALAQRHLTRPYGRGVQPKRKLLFEEYLEGPLYSAEGFIDGDELTIFGYSDRIMTAPPHFVEIALRFASERPHPEADVFVQRALHALDYKFGPFHLEFVLTPHGPRVVELNARLFGAGMEQAVSYLSTSRLADYVLAKITGKKPEHPIIEGAVTELRITAPATGRLVGVKGLEEASSQGTCRSAGLYAAIGEHVSHVIDSNSSRVAYVQATGKNRSESYRNATKAAEAVFLDIVDE